MENNNLIEDQMIQICTDIYYECGTIKKLDELTDKALALVSRANNSPIATTSCVMDKNSDEHTDK